MQFLNTFFFGWMWNEFIIFAIYLFLSLRCCCFLCPCHDAYMHMHKPGIFPLICLRNQYSYYYCYYHFIFFFYHHTWFSLSMQTLNLARYFTCGIVWVLARLRARALVHWLRSHEWSNRQSEMVALWCAWEVFLYSQITTITKKKDKKRSVRIFILCMPCYVMPSRKPILIIMSAIIKLSALFICCADWCAAQSTFVWQLLIVIVVLQQFLIESFSLRLYACISHI